MKGSGDTRKVWRNVQAEKTLTCLCCKKEFSLPVMETRLACLECYWRNVTKGWTT